MFNSLWDKVKARWAEISVCALGLLIWALFLPHTFAHDAWTYSWDSAPYVETANRLREGHGLSHRVIHGLGAQLWEPLTLWPPGYSLMIAAVTAFGVSAPAACLAVSIGAGALSLILLTLIALRFVRWYIAAPLVSVIAISVGFQQMTAQCLSDSSYSMWVLASVFCLVEWTRKETNWRWLFAAGVFAGAAWITRNAALSLLAATGLFFIAHLAWRNARDVVRIVAIWAGGVALCSAPLLIRNLVEFGKTNPYEMSPSEISLLDNAKQAINVVVRDLTTFGYAGAFAAHWAAPVALVICGVVGFALWCWRRSGGRFADLLQTRRAELFVLSYALFYAAIVVLARSRYRWGEVISTRYMVQMDWAVLLLLAVLAGLILSKVAMSAARRGLIIAAAFGLLFALHFREQSWLLTTPATAEAASPLAGTITPEACAYLDHAVRDDQIVLAERADILRIHCGTHARSIPPPVEQSDAFRRPLDPQEFKAALRSGLLWGVVINDRDAVLRGEMGPELQDALDDPAPDFESVPSGDGVFILRYIGAKDEDG